MIKTCYMCDAVATSREHTPPRSFFPEVATAGKDLRRNLITVPSCDLHNSSKSEDDEFFRATICLASAGITPVATQLFSEKVLEGARHSPGKYAGYAPKADVATPPGKSAFVIDRDRFDRCIDHLARALCFHVYDIKWKREVLVASPLAFARNDAGELAAPPRFLQAIESTRDFLAGEPIRGENSEVFLYRIRIENGTLALAAIFFEHFEVFAVSTSEP